MLNKGYIALIALCCNQLMKYKRTLLMGNLVVIELGVNEICFSKLKFSQNGFFAIEQQIKEPVKLTQDMERDGYIKPARIQETISVLKIFRRIIDANGIDNVICYVDPVIASARNQIAFLDEIYKTVSLHFKILTFEDQITALHIAVSHTFAITKGLAIQICNDTTQIFSFNRRGINESINLNFGASTLSDKFASVADPATKMDKMVDFATKEIRKINWLFSFEPETEFIGVGDIFESLGVLCRKSTHYSLDIAHNYEITAENFMQVFNVVRGLDIDKTKKLKGVSAMRADVLASGMAIVKALFNTVCNTFKVSVNGEMYGIVAKSLMPQLDKPLLDILGYSLSAINEFYPTVSNVNAIYDVAIILYKQLKILHRLNRNYVKILRIAASMSQSGKRISFENYEKNNFSVILGSNIYGASHREILLAGFVACNQNIDNFSLAEWVKYKDILDEEDIDVVKKLGMIIKLACLLNVSGASVVKDISCDVLGDTVILKTEVEKDPTLEISQAMAYAPDFKKIFGKNLQIL